MRAEAARGWLLVAVVIVVVVVVVVVLRRREARGYDTVRSERVVGRRMVVGTGSLSGSSGDSSNWQMQAQQALSRRSGLCGALRAIVPPCVSSLGLGSVGCWSWFTRLSGGGTARRKGRVDGALEGRGTRHEAQGAIG